MTGLERSVLSWPVVHTFQQRVLRVLHKGGYAAHSYLVLVGVVRSRVAALRVALKAAYAYRKLSFVPRENRPRDMVCPYPGSHRIWRAYLNGTEPQALREADKILVQWIGLRQCYADVEHAEAAVLRRRYDWILRTRTDLVYLSPVPLRPALPATRAYLPASGMTGWPQYRCMNDWMLLCPRSLCRRYFGLLDDVFYSRQCVGTATPSGPAHTYNTTYPRGMVAVPHDAPTQPFVLPQPPGIMNAEWYFYARFGDGRVCGRHEESPQCCGLLQEDKAWVAAKAVGSEFSGTIPCHLYLVERARPELRQAFTRPRLAACMLLNARWPACRSWESSRCASSAATPLPNSTRSK
jgi:hypothetical protein